MRILIVKLGSIGDIVHTLPALAAMRSALPQAEISWVAERASIEILRDNPLLDRLIEVDTKALRRGLMSGETLRAPRQQLRRLRASAFDIALDFQGLLKSASIARLSGARRVFGFSREGLREPASAFLLSKKVHVPKQTHVIYKALTLVEQALELKVPHSPEDLSFPIHISRDHQLEAEQVIDTSSDYAILNPAGGWPTKLWAPEKFGALADALWKTLGLQSVVTYGPSDLELANAVKRNAGTSVRLANVSLKGFYELASNAKVYVGGDTGPTHIAVAAGTPIVGIFGPTEWWRNGSPRPQDICVERNDIGCRVDCHRRSCANWICMDISVERVLEAVEKRLSAAGTRPRLLHLAG
ncbi:MAG TPA: lipopolysaccharide heptosyltransferase I [Pyrinomonadaceae bacterium]|nr:lipopolysaccharide heptosyltransferase I [Pyrinomonadaceae bacterium]